MQLILIAILCIVSATFGLVLGLFLRKNEKEIREFAGKIPVPKLSKQKAEFISNPSIEDEAVEKVIEDNEKKGRDTRLDEI